MELGVLQMAVGVEAEAEQQRAPQVRHKPLEKTPLLVAEWPLPGAAAQIEPCEEVVFARERNHCTVRDILRTQHFIEEGRQSQRRKRHNLVRGDDAAELVSIETPAHHHFRPGIMNMSLLEGAVALLAYASDVGKIYLADLVRLTEEDAALAAGAVGNLGQHRAPQLLLRRGVVDQVQKLFGGLGYTRQDVLLIF